MNDKLFEQVLEENSEGSLKIVMALLTSWLKDENNFVKVNKKDLQYIFDVIKTM